MIDCTGGSSSRSTLRRVSTARSADKMPTQFRGALSDSSIQPVMSSSPVENTTMRLLLSYQLTAHHQARIGASVYEAQTLMGHAVKPAELVFPRILQNTIGA